MSNKLMKNQSTRQIVSHLTKNIETKNMVEHLVEQNYQRMTVSGAQNRGNQGLKGKGTEPMVRTDYGQNKKWVSDRELVSKFDDFISKNHDEDQSLRESIKG